MEVRQINQKLSAWEDRRETLEERLKRTDNRLSEFERRLKVAEDQVFRNGA
ncbi:MAG: hypothetical protein AVDCRST_MAG56-1682 [uncultured Cytophagales bacterium]|uniref:Uncharacterized protein n=1 Tax=uncultured Cytophagales bacterium TaxID=158755 RepID=A0A6J4I8F8_9SPHI|nr:MAG: hypothetical protein AVDCRST_MAG56-1682 [uncultured Cytophagales bacterium]